MISAHRYFLSFVEKLSTIYDENEAKAIANYVSSELLMIRLNQLAIIDKTLEEADVRYFDAILSRLLTHEPVQYVLGFSWFYGLKLEINKSVLIPRPETEELVEQLILYCKASGITAPKIIDLCTGSGCIAIALKKNIPGATVYATDIMEDALETARQNARLQKVDVTFVKDDVLNPQHIASHGPFDMIISNPPYIAEEEGEQMHANVMSFEPKVALFAPGDPLKFYRAIHRFGKSALKSGGSIWLEINPLLAEETTTVYQQYFTAELLTDLSGKKRFVKAGGKNLS